METKLRIDGRECTEEEFRAAVGLPTKRAEFAEKRANIRFHKQARTGDPAAWNERVNKFLKGGKPE